MQNNLSLVLFKSYYYETTVATKLYIIATKIH